MSYVRSGNRRIEHFLVSNITNTNTPLDSKPYSKTNVQTLLWRLLMVSGYCHCCSLFIYTIKYRIEHNTYFYFLTRIMHTIILQLKEQVINYSTCLYLYWLKPVNVNNITFSTFRFTILNITYYHKSLLL